MVVAFMAVELKASTTHPYDSDFVKIRNHTEKILSRQRRLVYPGGGNVRFAGGYLIPTDIPLYQNINVLNNINFFYPLPPNLVSTFFSLL